MESQDRAEVDRAKSNVEQCRKTLQSLGYADFTFEDFFAVNLLSNIYIYILDSYELVILISFLCIDLYVCDGHFLRVNIVHYFSNEIITSFCLFLYRLPVY